MGVTTVGQHKMEIYDSKPTSKSSPNKVRIFRIGEIDLALILWEGYPETISVVC